MQSNLEVFRQALKSKSRLRQGAEQEMAMQNLNINARELPEAAWGAYISCSQEVPHWHTFL
jgi:hypothetical protein